MRNIRGSVQNFNLQVSYTTRLHLLPNSGTRTTKPSRTFHSFSHTLDVAQKKGFARFRKIVQWAFFSHEKVLLPQVETILLRFELQLQVFQYDRDRFLLPVNRKITLAASNSSKICCCDVPALVPERNTSYGDRHVAMLQPGLPPQELELVWDWGRAKNHLVEIPHAESNNSTCTMQAFRRCFAHATVRHRATEISKIPSMSSEVNKRIFRRRQGIIHQLPFTIRCLRVGKHIRVGQCTWLSPRHLAVS